MMAGKVSLVLICMLGVAQADTLSERLNKGMEEAIKSQTQENVRKADSKESSLVQKEFESKKFETKQFKDVNELGWEKKSFDAKAYNPGKTDTLWSEKKFSTKTNTDFTVQNRFSRDNQSSFTNTSRFNEMRVQEEKRAREDGVKTALFREKSAMSDMRYEGPELKKVSQEIKLINETLKNKDDLKDHKISIAEIREILNKNQ